MPDVYLGIDIGTSNSCCYVLHDGPQDLLECVHSAFGSALFPSVVAFNSKTCMVGEAAVRQQSANPMQTFVEFKRLVGATYNAAQLTELEKHWPFKLSAPLGTETDRAPRYCVMRATQVERYTAEDLYNRMLGHMIEHARAHVGASCTIRGVVVTVPAHFDAQQRLSVHRSATAAVGAAARVTVCNEPTAAAVAYGERQGPAFFASGSGDAPKHLLVFDFGAGTLDVTVLSLRGDQADHDYDVLASEGLPDIGGMDLDKILLDKAIAHYFVKVGRPLVSNKQRLVAVRASCESAKRVLSEHTEAAITFGDLDIEPMSITRAEFESGMQMIVRRFTLVVWKVLQAARLKPGDVGHVLLVGGSSRVPLVRQVLAGMMSLSHIHNDLNADQCVAMGAARLALAAGPLDLSPVSIDATPVPSDAAPVSGSVSRQPSSVAAQQPSPVVAQQSSPVPAQQLSPVPAQHQQQQQEQHHQHQHHQQQQSPVLPQQGNTPHTISIPNTISVPNTISADYANRPNTISADYANRPNPMRPGHGTSHNGTDPAGPNAALHMFHKRRAARASVRHRDVLTGSIGIRTGYNVMHVAVPKNTILPATWSGSNFLPHKKGQRVANICLFQGEQSCTSDNRYIGTVQLHIAPDVPDLRITITLSISADGILNVSAVDQAGNSVIGNMHI
jgi:molecular chaperone DnaK (HSP70)